MATASEIQSLEDIGYKTKIKFYLMPFALTLVFMMGFMNFYPVGDQLKVFLKKNLQGTACNPDYDQIRIEWLLPKVVVTDLSLPASCLGKVGDPLKFSHLTINFQFINFSPLGIPFKVVTEMNGQPLTVYYVQGFSSRMVRIKDQSIVISRLAPLMGDSFKLAGSLVMDLNTQLLNNNTISSLSFKAQSKDFQIPAQVIGGFTVPNLRVNDLYLEAHSASGTRIDVDKLIIGDADSPMRANFKGKIDLQRGNAAFSPMDLVGEVAFSESFKQTVPLIDAFFEKFTKKDGFYQIRLGGTLGQPTPMNP